MKELPPSGQPRTVMPSMGHLALEAAMSAGMSESCCQRGLCSTRVSPQPHFLLGQKLLSPVHIPCHTCLVQSTIDVVHECTNEVVGELFVQFDESRVEAQAEEKRARCIALLGAFLTEDGLCASVLHAIPQLSRGAVELPEKVDKGRPLCASSSRIAGRSMLKAFLQSKVTNETRLSESSRLVSVKVRQARKSFSPPADVPTTNCRGEK
mmetsp:Transcript_14739/g.35145  ORF Transcript_14739/g.35145 Transcript_14739/m.35145 type:complete len:209 (+) Transcript_14739:122-748(+)